MPEPKTILLADDEDALRTLLRAVLVQKGYQVLEADDGEKALWIAAQRTGSLDLLITDVTLAKMDGVEVAKRLRAAHPEMKVLYISGYLEGEMAEHCRGDSGCSYLQKPFSPAALAAAVQQALGCKVAGGSAS